MGLLRSHAISRISRAKGIRGVVAAAAVAAVGLAGVGSADAAIVSTVQLGTATSYSILAGSTVTNTGPTTTNANLGLSPGSSVTGFPPGIVGGTTNVTNAAAAQAQSDLTAAYVDAAGRSINATTTADLANLTLVGGVYAGPAKGALSLTGPLVLDGAGNASSVFIFQTDSTLTTASSSTVSLINGAQACNVFWQVGSSATLGTGSTFTGTILALTSITVTTGVTVNGRALARNAAVTLDNDVFQSSTCAVVPATTTTSSTSTTSTSTTTPRTTSTTVAGDVPTDSPTTAPTPGATTTTVLGAGAGDTTTTLAGGSTSQELPRTGASIELLLMIGLACISAGAIAVSRTRMARTEAPVDESR